MQVTAPLPSRKSLRVLIGATAVGAVTAGVVGVATAGSASASVNVVVDGTPRSITTDGHHVSEVLADAGLTVGPHDTVTPAPSTEVRSGAQIVLDHARPVHLTVDGSSRDAWVTARTVQDALGQLGVDPRGAAVSVPLTAPVNVQGASVAVRLPHHVAVQVDGRTLARTTTAADPRGILRDAGITLAPTDWISVPWTTGTTEGLTFRVIRVRGQVQIETGSVAFGVERRDSDDLAVGQTRVQQAGTAGTVLSTYEVGTIDGRSAFKRLVGQQQTKAPVPQIVLVGTHQAAAPTPAAAVAPAQRSPAGSSDAGGSDSSSGGSSGGGASSGSVPSSGSSSGGPNWSALARCESGGNPSISDPTGTYFGLYQFDSVTWHAMGGSGLPSQASASEQTMRAQKLYAMNGRTPWPVCGRYL